MQTVLIADDEENIREGIKLIIDWEELGFEIAGTASNGEEALSAISKLNPSLVVMDMQMPKIHGIDVIKKARASGYEGYFIILSGYSNFSYAQDAIRNRVTNYITKPVDEDELYDTVKRIKEEIDKSVKEGRRSGQMRNKARSVVISELLLGTYFDKSETSDTFLPEDRREELLSLHLYYPLYQVVIHETYHSGKKEKSRDIDFSKSKLMEGALDYKLTDLLPTFLDESSYETLKVGDYECILLKGKAAVSRFDDFIQHFEKAPIENDSPLDDIFIAIGTSEESPIRIEKSFESAKLLAKRRFFCDEGEHFVRAVRKAGNEEPTESSYEDIISEDLKESQQLVTNKILDAVIAGNRTAMINCAEELYDFIKEKIPANSDACLFATEILLQIKDRLTKQYPMLSEIFDSHAGIIEFIEGRFYLYEIIQYMTETMDKVLFKLHEHAASENIIDDIISYTDRNYAQPLTLEDLASRFGYNSGYLGRLFTRTTGTGYNYYLNECRIAKAKEFLAEGKYKVYEVAQLVGYNDVDYFGKKFRKHAGMTPAEFRRQMKESK
ncbi:response regulator transcription factor [Butyrivibrio sp. AE3004]|uniref:response regulator transcription factor n=1 Tax=Butyrivibrio sp. AE3004 TaxID=1506994 RepID=UPI000493FE6C|nr:response regulator [Butyrivibrio sp. AE3004]